MTPDARCKVLLSAMVVWLVVGVVPAVKAQELARSGVGAEAVSSSQDAYSSQPRPLENPTASKKRWRAAWIASWMAFAAVNILDAHSSAGGRELNPLLRDEQGRFSGRKAALVKSGIGGGFFAFQLWLVKRNPDENYYKTFTIATAGTAAGLGVIAVRNYGLGETAKAPASSPAPAYVLRQP